MGKINVAYMIKSWFKTRKKRENAAVKEMFT